MKKEEINSSTHKSEKNWAVAGLFALVPASGKNELRFVPTATAHSYNATIPTALSIKKSKMIYHSKIELPYKEQNKQYVFLAGSIDLYLSTNWRAEIINKIGQTFHFFDPTIASHNELTDVEMKNHINWELDAMNMADKIILHFLPTAKSPISLVELGLYATSKKLIVICPKLFYKSRYVYTLCEKYNVPVFENLDESLSMLK